jgi:hypothetical protein
VRVRIRDRSQLGSLVDYLKRCDCTLSFRDGELEVRPRQLPVDRRLRHEELELSSFLRVWAAFHPDAGVELQLERDDREHGRERTDRKTVRRS